VNWADRIDLETGRPVLNPAAQYDTIGAWVSPGGAAWGAHNWYPMSYHPRTGLVYIPGQNTVGFYQQQKTYTPVLRQFSTGTNRNAVGPAPEPDVGTPGFLVARDPVTNRDRWKIPYERGRNGGTMTSGENLLFSLQAAGTIIAHDARTGDVLWKHTVGPNPVAPITYEIDGRQYVAVISQAQGLPGRVWTFVLDGTVRSPLATQ
jgi:alcohol dehydrogenase (cytochrome c)/quinohemoprotein ethanol dehydrogenase